MHADPIIVDVFYILDFDRCLAHTEKFQPILEEVVRQTNPAISDDIYQARRMTIGSSFDTAHYVRRRLSRAGHDSEALWRNIEVTFISKAQNEDMLEPHGRELLDALDSHETQYGIVTFGGEVWQQAKIAAAGLSHVPYLVTDIKEKGTQIASWYNAALSGYLLPTALTSGRLTLASSLVFIDDNPISFTGLPSDVRGICVVPIENEVQMSPVEGLPSNVTVVHGLSEVVSLLFNSEAH